MCVGREYAPVVITFCLPPAKKALLADSFTGWSTEEGAAALTQKASSGSGEKHTERKFTLGSSGRKWRGAFVAWREERNYIGVVLYRQELNICSEALCNIIQTRSDRASYVVPRVPSGSEEERQTTCSYHNSVLLVTLHMLSKIQCSVHGINTSFIV